MTASLGLLLTFILLLVLLQVDYTEIKFRNNVITDLNYCARTANLWILAQSILCEQSVVL
jgi:hypothetical protein